MPAGDYALAPAAFNADGLASPYQLSTAGIVTGVSFENGVPRLKVGGSLVKMSDVTQSTKEPSMSLISSLYTGQTGLQTSSTDLSVIGDNIAKLRHRRLQGQPRELLGRHVQQMLGSGGVMSQGPGRRADEHPEDPHPGCPQQHRVARIWRWTATASSPSRTHNGRQGQFIPRRSIHAGQGSFFVNQEGLRVQGYSADPTGVLSPARRSEAWRHGVGAAHDIDHRSRANLDARSTVIVAPFDP